MPAALVLDYIYKSHRLKTNYNRVLGEPILKPITSIASYKQCVPQEIVAILLSTEIVDETLLELIHNLLLDL